MKKLLLMLALTLLPCLALATHPTATANPTVLTSVQMSQMIEQSLNAYLSAKLSNTNNLQGLNSSGSGVGTASVDINNPVQRYNNPDLAPSFAAAPSSGYGCSSTGGGSESGMGQGLSIFWPINLHECYLLHFSDKIQVQALRYRNLKSELVLCIAATKANEYLEEAREEASYSCQDEYADNLASTKTALKQAMLNEIAKAQYELHSKK